jgi:hypothetical protein
MPLAAAVVALVDPYQTLGLDAVSYRLRQPDAAAVRVAGRLFIVPEGLAAPYAHSLRGSTLAAGLLMAAMPTGMAVGAFRLGRIATRQCG